MKPQIKKEWVKALRSGKIKQGHDSLSQSGRYCCLGVLCTIAVKAGAMSRRAAFKGNEELNSAMQEWANCSSNPMLRVHADISRSIGRSCTQLNDNEGGLTFKQIADAIENTPANCI